MEVVEDCESFSSMKKVQWLRCFVQNYDWGRKGDDSQVAKFFPRKSDSEIEPEKAYAEFWMGTHDSRPLFLIPSGEEVNGYFSVDSDSESLKSWILKNPNVLGEKVVHRWGGDFPFLFKVLSVAKALSIQAHPDKELAKALHKLQPNLYKDGNHKPEMALTIIEFEALCGFISLEPILKGQLPLVVQIVSRSSFDQLVFFTILKPPTNQNPDMEHDLLFALSFSFAFSIFNPFPSYLLSSNKIAVIKNLGAINPYLGSLWACSL
ncbi:hypothetical protein UlMin_006210 [Ulmus minor]